MTARLLSLASVNRKRVMPILVTIALLAGLVVSIFATHNAQADYYSGCGYGYSSNGSGFGYGTGASYGYGYGNGGSFAYGYGNQVCPLAITTASLNAGTAGTAYASQQLTGTGGTGTYTWTESGSLDGLALSSSGLLSGTPTTSGTFPITVRMTDGNGQFVSGSFSLVIASGGGGGGGTTTTSTSTTTSTTVPATTTTVAPRPKPKPKLIFMSVVGLAQSNGVWLRFKCLSATCHARVWLSAILSVKHGRGSIKAYVIVAWRQVPLAKNHSGKFFFKWLNTGMATLGGKNHYRNLGLRLTSTVIGGSRHQQTIHISK